MKKTILLLLLLVSTIATALAIPPGAYCDDRGRVRYVVDRSGNEVYVVDSHDGSVSLTLLVVREELAEDGQTTIVIVQTKGMSVHSRLEYWTENGETYLHNGLQKFHRE